MDSSVIHPISGVAPIGSAETLDDVVDHYNRRLKLHLTEKQQRDLVEFLKSI